MRRSPLLAVGLALTVLGAALLLWVQRDAEAVGSSPWTSPFGIESSVPSAPAPVPSTSGAASAEAAQPSTGGRQAASDKPAATALRLRIPGIGLDEPMAPDGLSPEGTIDPTPGTVMWFEGYDRVPPGDVGTAVIAAHVTSEGGPDVFADLTDVEVGDEVEVLEPDGGVASYVVTSAVAIPKEEVTTDQSVWGVNTKRSRLAILTCDDAFGFRGDGRRVANLVLIAERR